MKSAAYEELTWLNANPKLEELIERYPDVWEEAGAELTTAAQSGSSQNLNEAAIGASSAAELWKSRIQKSRSNPKVIESAVRHIVRSRMIILAIDRAYLANAAGKTTGKVRFNLINGYIIQKLFFSSHLTRKPASLRWVKFWWRLLPQRRLLMPLVRDKGIYCFYSRELLAELRHLLDKKLCLEIGAGDGALSRLLVDTGIDITATDDRSWSYAIDYPESVVTLDARKALNKYQPQAVICCYPPPGNNFEKHVFATKSVQLYVVIGSRYQFVSGNWEDYAKQDRFEWAEDKCLSEYVLPPEVGNCVLIFRRKARATME